MNVENEKSRTEYRQTRRKIPVSYAGHCPAVNHLSFFRISHKIIDPIKAVANMGPIPGYLRNCIHMISPMKPIIMVRINIRISMIIFPLLFIF
jgi:hypothetical protein